MATTPNTPESLTISWAMPDPPVTPRNSYAFPLEALSRLAHGEPAEAEPLAVSREAYRLIYEGFRQGLGRFTAWEAPEPCPEPFRQAFTLAASIYKRGVSCSATAPSHRSGEYQITLASTASPLLTPKTSPNPSQLVVVDGNVAKHWPLFEDAVVIDNVSEQIKQLSLVERLIAAHRQRGQPGHWLIVGGGILCDTAAFAADLAGCPFTLAPTTLLAMADACVGGKTGVNFPPFGKNQLGRFAFPAKVVCCPEFLTSLPERELRCGIAECLKHGILSGDRPLIAALQAMAKAADFSGLKDHLLAVMAVKAKVVAADPGEAGQRATLNFGHTLGHGIEALCYDYRERQNTSPEGQQADHSLRHGEAVYYGMVFAAILSAQHSGLPAADRDSIIAASFACLPSLSYAALCAATGFDSAAPQAEGALFEALFAKMTTDKKNTHISTGAKPVTNWVLLAGMGRCFQDGGKYTKELSYDAIRSAWAEYITTLKRAGAHS